MSNLPVYDTPAIHIVNADVRKLRENDHIPVSATELETETLDSSAKQSRKRKLSHESNQAHSPSKPDASESVNDYASSMNLSPDSSSCFLLPVQYPTQEMGTVRMQNLRAFQAQQQFQSFSNPTIHGWNLLKPCSLSNIAHSTSHKAKFVCSPSRTPHPEYLSFRDQDRSTSSNSQLCEAWQERHEFTLATPKCDIHDTITRFNWGDYIYLSYAWGDCAKEKAKIFLDGIATRVSKRLEAALQDLRSSFECRLGMKV
ncbi:hypothetical protein DM02DRAFT_222042 [Periconia macrospinosa]|uniref:Uncharacterized protein n=1 Tax=Periconia macrospinosa TaxID=97972 RepID=A0A2V1D603_9PLEO|nr:hypothetical protein DM02DRAFT_222042 [Periconia macrospinosa]